MAEIHQIFDEKLRKALEKISSCQILKHLEFYPQKKIIFKNSWFAVGKTKPRVGVAVFDVSLKASEY